MGMESGLDCDCDEVWLIGDMVLSTSRARVLLLVRSWTRKEGV